MSKYYLKTNVKAEPLIWKWYAWPYLIPPITAASNIVGRHLKIMQSYVQNPLLHAHAVQDPRMLGGAFMDLDGQQVDEIRELISDTTKSCSLLIELNIAFKELDKILQSEAKGASLEDLYKRIPKLLKGFVELVYDLNCHPSIRLIEPFLYKTYYSDNYQEVALSNVTQDYRKFVLSTPRLDQTDEVYIRIPFSDKRLDYLFKSSYEPCELKDIKSLFDIPINKQQLFESFFTTIPPCQNEDKEYTGDGIRVRYFGHACILIQTKSVTILLDPVISYPISNSSVHRYTFDDLPSQIDYVIITHNHQDHFMLEILLRLRHKIKNVVFPSNHQGALADPSIKLILEHVGFSSLIEAYEAQPIKIEGGEIIPLPFLGEHSDLNIQSKLSYYVRLNDKKFLFAADSNNLDESLYNNIFNITGSIDTLFLGMECDGAPLTWLYGPLLTNQISRAFDKSRTLSGSNYEKAILIVEKLQCKRAYIYAMGLEPWLKYVMALSYSPDSIQILESKKFIKSCLAKGIESERLYGQKEWIM